MAKTGYEQLGIALSPHAVKPDCLIGSCPLCGADHMRFGVKPSTTQFGCFKCCEKGNMQTFIPLFWEMCQHDPERVAELAKYRKISEEELSRWDIRINPLNNDFLIPSYHDGRVKSLMNYYGPFPKPKLLNIGGVSSWCFGERFFLDSQRKAFITEGLWDTMRVHQLVVEAGMDEVVRVVGCPGVSSWSGEWNQYVEGLDTYILFDNDYLKVHAKNPFFPSINGMLRTGIMLDSICKSLHMLLWHESGVDDELPDGYDMRDHINLLAENDETPKAIIKDIVDRCQPFDREILENIKGRKQLSENPSIEEPDDIPEIKPTECQTIEEVLGAAADCLCTPQEFRDCFILCTATILSTQIPGDQLWFRMYGPPGSGKSTIAEAFSCNKRYTYPRSFFTGLNSGYNKGKGKASLVGRMDGKCFITKDADTIVNNPNIDAILAEFRDLYDRVMRTEYRNKVCETYEQLSNTVIWCGTDVLRQLNRSFLGDRFLDMNLFNEASRQEYYDRAFDNARSVTRELSRSQTQRGQGLDVFYSKTSGFLDYICGKYEREQLPSVPEEYRRPIQYTAELLSYVRARSSSKHNYSEEEFKTRREMANRVIGQFVKLISCVAGVYQHDVGSEELRLMMKTFRDTVEGNRLEILRCLSQEQLDVKTIAQHCSIPDQTARELIDSLLEFRVICKVPRKGSDSQEYDLTQKVKALWKLTNQIETI